MPLGGLAGMLLRARVGTHKRVKRMERRAASSCVSRARTVNFIHADTHNHNHNPPRAHTHVCMLLEYQKAACD